MTPAQGQALLIEGFVQKWLLESDSVEQVGFGCSGQRWSVAAAALRRGESPHAAGIGVGTWISLASFLRFWAVAARWNSSRAPQGPRSRNLSSFKMRLRCANSISTFLRWRREVW